jgi:hypothetical protein
MAARVLQFYWALAALLLGLTVYLTIVEAIEDML